MDYIKRLVNGLPRRLALVLVIAAIGLLIWFAIDIVAALARDLDQLITALAAAVVMGAIGGWLTFGRGVLAGTSQYDRLLVWSALGLSIVSAVTTTTGLQDVLSSHRSNSGLLAMILAFVLGISAQAYMLTRALSIGEGVHRVNPRKTAGHRTGLSFEEKNRARKAGQTGEETTRNRARRGNLALLLVGLVAWGVWVYTGGDLSQLAGYVQQMIGVEVVPQGTKNPIGLLIAAISVVLLFRIGVLPAAAAVSSLASPTQP